MKKATTLLKRIVTLLSSIAKAKSMAIKNKTNAFKARLLMLSLMKHKKLAFGSISNKIQHLLGHNEEDDDQEVVALHEGHENDEKSKAIILYNAAPCTGINGVIHDYGNGHYDDKYPDLRHTLFEGEDEFGDLDHQGGSIIEMVRSSKEGEGERFSLEDEIDHVADLFISRFHKQMRLQKLLSFKRHQEEMLKRST